MDQPASRAAKTIKIIHPIWSLDRDEWLELGQLDAGEQVSGQAGPATVLSLTILNQPTPVYNIEVHGEHVYQVGCSLITVHNAAGCIDTYKGLRSMIKGSGPQAHNLVEKRFAGSFGEKARDMMSIVVNPMQHQVLTNAWRTMFPYGTNYAKLSPAQVETAARQIYAKYPNILAALGL